MNLAFQLRTGKHTGKTLEWVKQNEPTYLSWIKENRPEMLKGSEDKPKIEKKEIQSNNTPIKSMVPNLNFWNEGPADICKLYLKMMQEKDSNDLVN